MHPKILFLPFVAVLFLNSAVAQRLGVPGANAGASALGIARPILVSGNVRTSSGEAPSELVGIRRVCGTDSFIEGYTNHEGEFTLEIGDTRYVMVDAAAGGAAPGFAAAFNAETDRSGVGVDLSHCRLVAESSGYRSSHIQLSRHSSLDHPGVGTLILTPWGGSSAALVSATTLAAPKSAQEVFRKAVKELSRAPSANRTKAIALLEKALSDYSEYAAAWSILGETKQLTGDTEGAAEAFGRALEADPGYLRPYEPLALIRVQQQEWEQVVKLTRKALSLDPANTVLHWLHAISQFKSNNIEEALASLDRVESDEAGVEFYPEAHHIRGLIHSARGEFAEAAEELRLFLTAAPDAPAALAVQQRLDEWRALGVI